MSRESVRLRYTSDRDADQVRQNGADDLKEYEEKFDSLTPGERLEEARRMYGLGVKVGGMLFDSPVAQEPERFPDDTNRRTLVLPSLGSFMLKREFRDADMAYFLSTDTETGLTDSDHMAVIQPEFVHFIGGMGGRAAFSQLGVSFDTFDTLREEAGLPRVTNPLTLVK
jgi:hypothetical protein